MRFRIRFLYIGMWLILWVELLGAPAPILAGIQEPHILRFFSVLICLGLLEVPVDRNRLR